MIQLVKKDAARAIKLAQVAACPTYAHPAFDTIEGVEGDGIGDGAAISGIEAEVRRELMMSDAAFSAFSRAGGGDEVAEFFLPGRCKSLPLHSFRISIAQ